MENSRFIDKVDLRKFLRTEIKRRREKTPELLLESQKNFTENLRSFLKDKEGVWAGFSPLPDEPSVQEAMALNPQITWAFPRIEGEDLEFWISTQGFHPNSLGVMEPNPDQSQFVSVSDIQGFLVPGLGFDVFGARIGRGKGFYDRVLKKSRGEKVGVIFSEQVMEQALPCDPWDVRMDVLVTDQGVKSFGSPEKK